MSVSQEDRKKIRTLLLGDYWAPETEATIVILLDALEEVEDAKHQQTIAYMSLKMEAFRNERRALKAEAKLKTAVEALESARTVAPGWMHPTLSRTLQQIRETE